MRGGEIRSETPPFRLQEHGSGHGEEVAGGERLSGCSGAVIAAAGSLRGKRTRSGPEEWGWEAQGRSCMGRVWINSWVCNAF